jgi:hypothetical protein
MDQSSHDAEQRSLAATARAEQADELTLAHLEIDVVEHGHLTRAGPAAARPCTVKDLLKRSIVSIGAPVWRRSSR